MIICTDGGCEICPSTDFMTSGWFEEHYFEKGNRMTNREKELERQVVLYRNLSIRSLKSEIQSTAMMMLAQAELLGEDLEKDEPELYRGLKGKADGSWLQKGVE